MAVIFCMSGWKNRQGTSLAGIWEEETRTYLPVIGIPQDMLKSLIRLGGELGNNRYRDAGKDTGSVSGTNGAEKKWRT